MVTVESSGSLADREATNPDEHCWQRPRVEEAEWLLALAHVPIWIPPAKPTVVIAPHPDDETLGAGGLIAWQRFRGLPVTVIAVTDGEAAYSDQPDLGAMRKREQEGALEVLGVAPTSVVRLALPDGKVASQEDLLKLRLTPLVPAGSLLVAPWKFDFHPDHEACGRVAERLALDADATLVSYLFWSWHRGTVEEITVTPLRRFVLNSTFRTIRRKALSQHRSQLQRQGGIPILSEAVLGPIDRFFETLVVHE